MDVIDGPAGEPSVRRATSADVAGIGAVLERTWRGGYAGLLPPVVLPLLSGAALADAWRSAVTDPPSPRHVVLVARTGGLVVGMVAVAPSRDGDADAADGEVVELAVDPAHQRAGHGSRLLAAAAETLRDKGSRTIRIWTAEVDDVRYGFLVSTGLRPDGARRTLQARDGTELVQLRLSAVLPEPA